jgi:hypothetical protein
MLLSQLLFYMLEILLEKEDFSEQPENPAVTINAEAAEDVK